MTTNSRPTTLEDFRKLYEIEDIERAYRLCPYLDLLIDYIVETGVADEISPYWQLLIPTDMMVNLGRLHIMTDHTAVYFWEKIVSFIEGLTDDPKSPDVSKLQFQLKAMIESGDGDQYLPVLYDLISNDMRTRFRAPLKMLEIAGKLSDAYMVNGTDSFRTMVDHAIYELITPDDSVELPEDAPF